jgi:hypothetical protein
MISGPWDFAGVLVALSGFLLVGGTTLVFTLHGLAQGWLIRGVTWHDFAETHARENRLTWLIWGAFVVVLIGGALWQLRVRRNSLVIYNISPEELEDVLKGLFERLGLPWERHGNLWTVGGKEQVKAAFQTDGSSAMRSVSWRWQFAASEATRTELEAELARDLAVYPSPESRTAGWFITAAASIFTIMIFLLATFLMVLFRV